MHFLALEPPNSGDDVFSHRRGDHPMFNFDEADRILVSFALSCLNKWISLISFLIKIVTLQELIEALRKLKEEVNNQREETTSLKKALQECLACKIKKPECGDNPPPCFPK